MQPKIFPAQEIGSLKKPDWLIKLLRDPKASKDEKERARDDLAYINIKMLEDAGLDLVYDGEARRVEMYEYPLKHFHGLEFCGRVRVWDNKYFKKARCVDKVGYKGCYHLDEFLFVKKHARKGIKIPVTGPYTLADWSYNEYYPTREEFILDMAKEVIRPLLRDLVQAGAERIQIDEPAATTHPKEVKVFVEAFNEAVAGLPARVSVHICYSDYGALFPEALNMKTSQFALEFANRDGLSPGVSKEDRTGYGALDMFREYGDKREVGLGVVDVHRDGIEPPELIRDRILYAVKVLGDPERVYVSPDCGLRTRARQVAFAKLRNMVEGARLAREKLQSS